jgi:hypothetical protein
MSGATVLINRADNTFTVVIEKDFHYWAGNPNLTKNSFGLVTEGQQNLHWLKQQFDEFLAEQWKGLKND